MWKAIRLHPWRLEIVPAVAFALTVWSVCVIEIQSVDSKGSGYQFMILVGLGMALVTWILGAGSNHRWVQSERRKRFNWNALIYTSTMLCTAWIAYSTSQINLFMKHLAKHQFDKFPTLFDYKLLGALLVGGIALTALLEWNRHYIPRPEEPELDLPAENAETSHYREMSIDWWFALIVPIIWVMTIWWYMQSKSLEDLIMFLLGTLFLASLSIRIWIVTPTTLTYWPGIPGVNKITIADIYSCVPTHHEPSMGRRNRKPEGFRITDGRCMEICMKDGRICHFGALRPKHICEMVERAMRDLQEQTGE